jgi:4-diphosphocytidyl-2-C-methyl-D-erythritol kinase
MRSIRLKAYAKINLGLDVIRKREDGYHEVRMIMQTVKLYDRIELQKKKKQGITVSTNLYYVPANENNLAYKAAKLLADEFGIKEGVHIDLKKMIPVAAGMAGGSSDAASVMYGMNKMFDLGLDRKELMERGVKIGADVPYCIMRGTALSEGIGEALTKLPPVPACRVLIAKPPVSVSTKYVYENLRADRIESHPDIDGMMEALKEGDLYGIAERMENVLETVTIKKYPVIGEIKNKMKQAGAVNALMSGSGPTVFGIFDDERKIRRAYYVLKKSGLAKQIYLTEMYNNR